MKLKRAIYAAICMLLFTGCVSTKEYKARLSEISGLKDYSASLEEQLNAARAGYDAEVKELGKEIVRLKKAEADLVDANAELAHQMESDKLDLVKEITRMKSELSEEEFQMKALRDELDRVNEELVVVKEERELLEQEKQQAIRAKKEAVSELKGTFDELVSELNEEIQKGRVEVKQLRDKLSLSMVDKVLFDSGSAKVKADGRKVLDRVAEILVKVTDKQIRIEGHSDNVKIGSRLREVFPTNWELSTARATNVVRYLVEQGGMDPELLSAAGYSEYRPVASNETEEGKAKNRRIEIVLIPQDIDRILAEEEKDAQPE